MHPLPCPGLSLTLSRLRRHRNWPVEHERDLGIQDSRKIELIAGDWRPAVDESGIRGGLEPLVARGQAA